MEIGCGLGTNAVGTASCPAAALTGILDPLRLVANDTGDAAPGEIPGYGCRSLDDPTLISS